MQRVLPLAAGLQAYLELEDPADVPGAGDCPLCPSRHRLRRHGWYERWAYLPEGQRVVAHRLRVRRLLCPCAGCTVSLLPDFCLPRRQYGPEALGLLLHLYAFVRQALLRAFRALRPQASGHSAAQHLVRGFLRRQPQLRAYSGGLFARMAPPPPGFDRVRLEVLTPLLPLLVGHPDAACALRRHGGSFHARFALGLA